VMLGGNSGEKGASLILDFTSLKSQLVTCPAIDARCRMTSFR
jgi:hypothetical protein